MKTIFLMSAIWFALPLYGQDEYLGGIGSIRKAPHLGLAYMLLHEHAGFAIDAGFTLLTAALDEPKAREGGSAYIASNEDKLPLYITDAFQIGAMPIFRVADRLFVGVGITYYDYTEKWYRFNRQTLELTHASNDDRRKRGLGMLYRIGAFPFERIGVAYSYSMYRGYAAEVYFRF